MNRLENRPEKRSQRDYNLGFKLAVISQVEKGEFTSKQTQKKYGIQGRIIALAAGAAGLLLVSYRIKKEYFSNKECVQWNKDHYEEVVCAGSKIVFADVNPIIERQESVLDFKKIEVSDTTTFFKNKQPVIWYCKKD